MNNMTFQVLSSSVSDVLLGKNLLSHLWIGKMIPTTQGCTKKLRSLTELIILYTLGINDIKYVLKIEINLK